MVTLNRPSDVIAQISRQYTLMQQQINETKAGVDEALTTPRGLEFSSSEDEYEKEVFDNYIEALTSLTSAEKRLETYLKNPEADLKQLDGTFDYYKDCCSDVFDSSEELYKVIEG